MTQQPAASPLGESRPPTAPADSGEAARLADPAIRAMLVGYARSRVPEADAEDVVQTILVAALAAPRVPSGPVELRRWLIGIARHKVADLHRERKRLRTGEVPAQAVEALDEASEWLLWAEKQVQDRDGARALSWLARESEGEKLAQIAASETVPAPQLRQRVSRLRRLLQRRWRAELAVLSLLLLAGLIGWRLLHPAEPQALPELSPHLGPFHISADGHGRIAALEMRLQAVAACDQGLWQECLDILEGSIALAPESADEPLVKLTRARAQQALEWQRVEKVLEERRPPTIYKSGP